MVSSAAQQLADLLQRTNEAPIERGAMALLESIAGGNPISADVSIADVRQLTDEERVLLGTPSVADVHRREGMLRSAAGFPIAGITALMVTSRVPEPARLALGITLDGRIERTPQKEQASRALHGLGITREQLSATTVSGHLDNADPEIAVRSTARLWTPSGWPLALVIERVYAQFLAAYPPPWPLTQTTAGTT